MASLLKVLLMCTLCMNRINSFPIKGPTTFLPTFWKLSSLNNATVDPTSILSEKFEFLHDLLGPDSTVKRSMMNPIMKSDVDMPTIGNPTIKDKIKEDLFNTLIEDMITQMNPFLNEVLKNNNTRKSKDLTMPINDNKKDISLRDILRSIEESNDALKPISVFKNTKPFIDGGGVLYVKRDGLISPSTLLQNKLMSSLTKELSSLKEEIMNTAGEIKLAKVKKPAFQTFPFRTTTPDPLQEKINVLSNTFDALAKMEADINSDASSFTMPDDYTEQNTLGESLKSRRALSIGLRQGYNDFPPGTIEHIGAGAGSDATHEGGGIKMKIKIPLSILDFPEQETESRVPSSPSLTMQYGEDD